MCIYGKGGGEMKQEDKQLLKIAQTSIDILFIILAILCVGFGIGLCVYGNWVAGLLLLFGGLLICYGLWALVRLFILHVKNVQAIRDEICKGRNSAETEEDKGE